MLPKKESVNLYPLLLSSLTVLLPSSLTVVAYSSLTVLLLSSLTMPPPLLHDSDMSPRFQLPQQGAATQTSSPREDTGIQVQGGAGEEAD